MPSIARRIRRKNIVVVYMKIETVNGKSTQFQFFVVNKTHQPDASDTPDRPVTGHGFSFKYSAVVESREIPPLPVSRIKFIVSGKSPNWPCNKMTHLLVG